MPKVAQALAGHSDINLTMGVYTDLEMDELRDAVGRLDAFVKADGAAKKPESDSQTPSAGTDQHEGGAEAV